MPMTGWHGLFKLDLSPSTIRRMQVLPAAGGWLKVLNCFESDHIGGMDRHAGRFMILLIDFDGQKDRLNFAKGKFPERLRKSLYPRRLERTGSAQASDGFL
jgi:hypothetical protein